MAGDAAALPIWLPVAGLLSSPRLEEGLESGWRDLPELEYEFRVESEG